MDKYRSKLSRHKARLSRSKVIEKTERITEIVRWFDSDQQFLPVFINNRDRLTSTRKLVTWLEQVPYVKIVILDNDSTYPPLLEWYSSIKHRILFLEENLGQCSLWVHNKFTENNLQIQFQFQGDWYVYSDSDIVPREECPLDALDYLKQVMIRHPSVYKVGLGLEIGDLPDCFALKRKIQHIEGQYWASQVEPGVFSAGVDTTFALYHKQRGSRSCADLPPPHQGHQLYPALRTDYPYVARHLPWYVDTNSLGEEDRYYLERANPRISTWAGDLK